MNTFCLNQKKRRTITNVLHLTPTLQLTVTCLSFETRASFKHHTNLHCVCFLTVLINISTLILNRLKTPFVRTGHKLMWPSLPEMSRIATRWRVGYVQPLSQRRCHNIDFGFWTKSVSPVFSTSEKYTCYTHTHTQKFIISVICKCSKQAALQ